MNRDNYSAYETEYIREEIARCEDIDEFKSRVIPLLKAQREAWTAKIQEIILKNNYSNAKLGELCGVSKVAVGKWLKGSIPKNREMFLRIGLAAKYNLEQMNNFLQRYGRHGALYSKSLEDCICMFVISQNYGEKSIEKYQYILSKIKDSIVRRDDDTVENVSTAKFDAKVSEIRDENELEEFITDNIAVFSFTYHKFYAYVKMWINITYPQYATSVHNMAEGQGWSSSLKKCVYKIMKNKWYPDRNKIISLGIHLGMDMGQINQMLQLAHMEPLCAKNIFESVIMFILEDASLNNMLDVNSDDYDQDALCRYAKSVLSEVELSEVASFISELAEISDEV